MRSTSLGCQGFDFPGSKVEGDVGVLQEEIEINVMAPSLGNVYKREVLKQEFSGFFSLSLKIKLIISHLIVATCAKKPLAFDGGQ